MRRHAGLIPLSHDHHDALVVAQGLILGRAPAPRSDWPTDRRAQVDRVVAFFAQTLRSHFEAEEAHLFPAVVARLPGAANLVGQLLDECRLALLLLLVLLVVVLRPRQLLVGTQGGRSLRCVLDHTDQTVVHWQPRGAARRRI